MSVSPAAGPDRRTRSLRYQICDVFTDRALAGNALAVFTDPGGLDGATMQALAREMNRCRSPSW